MMKAILRRSTRRRWQPTTSDQALGAKHYAMMAKRHDFVDCDKLARRLLPKAGRK
jgi:hypothetical protein